MKLLEKGPGWNMECKCTGYGNGGGGCGARLLIESGDIYLTHRYYIDGSHDMFYTFKCMECGVETDIDESKVPGNIRRGLIEEYKQAKTLRR